MFAFCRSAPYAVRQARRPVPIAPAMPCRRDAAAGTISRRMLAGRAHQGDPPASLAVPCKSGAGMVRGPDKGGCDPHQTARTEACAGSSAAANSPQGANGGVGVTPGRNGENAGSTGTGDGSPSTSDGTSNRWTAAADSSPEPPLKLKAVYSMGDGECTCDGIEIGVEGFDNYVSERVEPRRTDAEGMQMVEQALAEVESSGFKAPALERLRSPSRPPEKPWRTGEALAECYLEDFESASFPYPRLRDERNPYAYSAGPDLVGYASSGRNIMFLFGEVKTTGETTRPPSVVWDLRVQLERLRSGKVVSHLIQQLVKKARSGSGEPDRRRNDEALRSYAMCKWATAGILISDQEPDKVDLEAAFVRLERGCGPGTGSLRLVGLYVPVPISGLERPAGRGA